LGSKRWNRDFVAASSAAYKRCIFESGKEIRVVSYKAKRNEHLRLGFESSSDKIDGFNLDVFLDFVALFDVFYHSVSDNP
jgi:hypothetical protein